METQSTRRPWIIAAAALVTAAVAGLWAGRREWTICVDGIRDGEPYGYCADGVFSLAAIIGTAALGLVLVAYVVIVLRTDSSGRGRRMRGLGLAAIVAAIAGSFILLTLRIEPIPPV